MKNLYGKFKTGNQLEASGWMLTDIRLKAYTHPEFPGVTVPGSMLAQLQGRIITSSQTMGWRIIREMLITESDTVLEILKKYGALNREI